MCVFRPGVLFRNIDASNAITPRRNVSQWLLLNRRNPVEHDWLPAAPPPPPPPPPAPAPNGTASVQVTHCTVAVKNNPDCQLWAFEHGALDTLVFLAQHEEQDMPRSKVLCGPASPAGSATF